MKIFYPQIITVIFFHFLAFNLFGNNVVKKNKPENISYKKVAKEIVKNKVTEVDKVEAIFLWISKNISYDYKGFNNGYWEKFDSYQDVLDNTFRQKKGVCAGYSLLFKKLCEEVGIEAVVIDGYSRNENYLAGKPIVDVNHSWNAVKIDKKWQLLDVTWASTNKVNEQPNSYYFCTKPDEFIINHFPIESRWQLLKNTIKKEEFNNYPYVSYLYYTLGFKNVFSKVGYVANFIGDFIFNNLQLPDGYKVLARLYSYKDNIWLTDGYSFDRDRNNAFVLHLKNRGSYMLEINITSNENDQFKIYKGLICYNVDYTHE